MCVKRHQSVVGVWRNRPGVKCTHERMRFGTLLTFRAFYVFWVFLLQELQILCAVVHHLTVLFLPVVTRTLWTGVFRALPTLRNLWLVTPSTPPPTQTASPAPCRSSASLLASPLLTPVAFFALWNCSWHGVSEWIMHEVALAVIQTPTRRGTGPCHLPSPRRC